MDRFYGHLPPAALDSYLTAQHRGEPMGERMVVAGKVTDSDGRPV